MTDTKHTPGPWVLHFDDDGEYSGEIRAWGDCDYDGCVADWVAEENAHLIAAAPELLEALEGCVSAMESLGVWYWLSFSDAKKAIAKARGDVK